MKCLAQPHGAAPERARHAVQQHRGPSQGEKVAAGHISPTSAALETHHICLFVYPSPLPQCALCVFTSRLYDVCVCVYMLCILWVFLMYMCGVCA